MGKTETGVISPQDVAAWKAHRFRSPLPKRERAKIKRAFKRQYGLTRRECGAIGAGHVPGIGA